MFQRGLQENKFSLQSQHCKFTQILFIVTVRNNGIENDHQGRKNTKHVKNQVNIIYSSTALAKVMT